MSHIIFFGDDQYSAIVLTHLLSSSQDIALVVTTTPKPSGRSQDLVDNQIIQIAKKHHLPLEYYPEHDIQNTAFFDKLGSITKNSNTVGVLASFGKIIPESLISLFDHKNLLCIHPSLLPQYRGATPAQHAIALGDKQTGVTLFCLTTKVDQGEIISQAPEPIYEDDTTPTLLQRLFAIGSQMFIEWLNSSHSIEVSKPSIDKPIFTRRFNRDTGFIEWDTLLSLTGNSSFDPSHTSNALLNLRQKHNNSTHILHDLVRALTPWPKVWTIAKTTKGEIRLSIESVLPTTTVKIAGKPQPINWEQFKKYYL